MQAGQRLWIEELNMAKEGSKEMPSRDLFAEFHLHFFAAGLTTTENIKKVAKALDAAYCHIEAIHHESSKSTYNVQRRPQDWIDNQQLMYLADPECTFVTADARLITRIQKSTQRTQVCHFDEFAARF